VLATTQTGSNSSTSSGNGMNLQKDGIQHMPKVKKQNKINLELTAANAGLQNKKRKREVRSCDSGLAAKRLKALQTKLAEEREREGTSEGRKCEEPSKRIQKLQSPSRRIKKLESSSTSSSGFSKCSAAKRLEALQRKNILDRNRGHKQGCIQEGSGPSKKQQESCGRGLELEGRSPSCDINTRNRHISDERYLDQNLSARNPYLTAEETKLEDELMEWEPIEDEKILSHIQEVRTQFQHNIGINLDRQQVDYGMNSNFFADGTQQWFIVLDTNVLISSLKYIEELRDTNFKGLGFPVLVIPWQVLQELDILKTQRCSTSSSLTARARRAVSFLHSNFMSDHPRIRGQSALDSVAEAFKIEVPDDAILHCCLQIAQTTNRVILLSNDKNLCNKAIVNGIKAYQKVEIQQALDELGSESVDQVQMQSASGNELPTGHTDIPEPMDSLPTDKEASIADSVFCNLKSLLKELLSKVLESEMYKAYDTSWKIIVAVKPPWTLSDILICLLKHWIAVFGFVLPKRIKPTLEFLNGVFGNVKQSKGYGRSLHEVRTVLEASLQLCMGIDSNEYHNLVLTCLTNIKRLQKHCEETLSA
jgi:rRNA-processing protein FCF1